MGIAYKYEFGGNVFPSLNADEQWNICFPPQHGVKATDLRDACVKHALDIGDFAEGRGEKVMLHLSGGDDSQAMVLAFMDAKVPFDITTRVYSMGGQCINIEDVSAASSFCGRYGLDFDYHRIPDFDAEWRTTHFSCLRDLSVLGARMGALHYPEHYNVLGTAPFISSKGNEWTLLTTWSVEAAFGRSFYLGDRDVFHYLINHDVYDKLAPGLAPINEFVKQGLPSRAQFMADVFTYEKLVKPVIMYEAFPELMHSGRAKGTGFELIPEHIDLTPTKANSMYQELARNKAFRIPLSMVRTFTQQMFVTKARKEDGMMKLEHV